MRKKKSKNITLENVSEIKMIAERLSKLDVVNKYDKGEHKEAWAIADSLSCIEESSLKITNELLPKLSDSKLHDEQIIDVLSDIGEELRHLTYNLLKKSAYFKMYTELYSKDEG